MELKNRVEAARHRSGGMAMVEMVIILPVLLMLLFAIAEFGLVFTKWQTLTNAAREGAREAIVFRTDCDAATVESEVRTKVTNYTNAGGVTLPDPNTDIQVTGACGAANTDTSVSVTYDYTFMVLDGFAPGLSPTLTLSGSATMRNEGNS